MCAFFSPQTFVNDVRIQEQMYITLKLEDKLRFGYDILQPPPAPGSSFHGEMLGVLACLFP